MKDSYDVVILGSGLAGLSLCRHLLLRGLEGRILLVDNKSRVPPPVQKVGESLVQVGGYYFSKVLDLEEHLFREHYLKYNLRFYWRSRDHNNLDFEDYAQSYIRVFSNVCSYQLDRNKLEAHLLEVNTRAEQVDVRFPTRRLKVALSTDGDDHLVRFSHENESCEVSTRWLIDTTGRGQFLKRKQDLESSSPIRHGASFCWVDGLVNIEKLTDSSPAKIRTKRDRQHQGMTPLWLATNHFCGEGFWFWVIPLQGKTSLGLVYDQAVISADDVKTAEQLIAWACKKFPLFERDLLDREVLDFGRLPDFAYDCRRTISENRWAVTGMSGRFTDPLYSPGSDLIAYYNGMIVEAIMESDPEILGRKCEVYEALMRVVYEAYLPSYAVSYDALGDQEVFNLKYAWELAIYFGFYVFPFINDFFTDLTFIPIFFRKFALLGPINRNLQQFLSDYFQWKKLHGPGGDAPRQFFDFTSLTPLARAEKALYKTGLSVAEAEEELSAQLENLKEFARYIAAYLCSIVANDPGLIRNAAFIRKLKLRTLRFDPDQIRQWAADCRDLSAPYEWSLDPGAMELFRPASGAGSRRVSAPSL